MKKTLLTLLVCPSCQNSFGCTSRDEEGNEVITGELHCKGCGAAYPISNGIPRIFPAALTPDKQKTARSFGWEWQRFAKLHDERLYTEQFLDWIAPLSADAVRGRTVLDAGCGMGRFAHVCSALGAAEVVAVDLSDAVDVACANTKELPNIHVVQADIYHLPFRQGEGDFDFVYSIGVLHHLPDPQGGFQALTRHVKPGGTIFGWVYGFENNEWYLRLVNPVRRITSRMSYPLLYALSFALTVPLQLCLKLLYAPADRWRWLGWLKLALPYKYFFWLSRFGFRHTHHVVFDQLSAPTATYLKREEFEPWFARAKLEDVAISSRNENSWRGYGRKPATVTG